MDIAFMPYALLIHADRVQSVLVSSTKSKYKLPLVSKYNQDAHWLVAAEVEFL